MPDNPNLENRQQILTIYGRNAVFEALSDSTIACLRLHWATSNQKSSATNRILQASEARGIPVREHTRKTLSRISRNGKQDQGVALDITCDKFGNLEQLQDWVSHSKLRILALDGITNPQNVGMIIRSAVAGGVDAILYPRKGVASLGPLVIKASAGIVFKAPIILCETLTPALEKLQRAGAAIASLEGDSTTSLFDYRPSKSVVFVLGGETDGVSSEVSYLADAKLHIPMGAGVESLNVAVAASLVAYSGYVTGLRGMP
ncbi:MAG: RNA methyltransferase [Luminiphilus sp.]|jgi:23S rRNA (guanosine2251-2'-O)-methyltransferase|nr:RNA methyltransferase [Luminiphilus sp.]